MVVLMLFDSFQILGKFRRHTGKYAFLNHICTYILLVLNLNLMRHIIIASRIYLNLDYIT